MITIFNYNRNDEGIFNDIVDGAAELVQIRLEERKGEKRNRKEYAETLDALNGNIAKYLAMGTRFESRLSGTEGRNILKNPQFTRDLNVRNKFDAVIAEIMNVVIPMTTSEKFGETFMDVHQVGWGDTARFLVSSNELFKVNEIAEGIRRGILQPIYNNEYTIDTATIEIATSIDWYSVAAGNFDWGQFGLRAGRSFEGYIMLKGIVALASATTEMGAAYSAAGFSTTDWTTLVDRVSSANGGAAVYGLGTLAALNKIIPSTVGLQYGLGQEVAKDGYLDRYLGARLIPMDQVIRPGTVNSTADLLMPTNVIYLVATDEYKPVKVVFEGTSTVVEWIPEQTTDKTYAIGVQMKVGVGTVVGSKFGTITLANG